MCNLDKTKECLQHAEMIVTLIIAKENTGNRFIVIHWASKTAV